MYRLPLLSLALFYTCSQAAQFHAKANPQKISDLYKGLIFETPADKIKFLEVHTFS